jgi:hypothetical protein
MIEAKMIDILLADGGITAICGTRIFPVVVRQTTALPSLTYRRLPGGDRTYSLAGRGHFTSVVVALYAWAADYPTARSLADQVRDALDAYTSNDDAGIHVATVNDLGDEWIDDLVAFGCGLEVTLKFLEV